MRKNYLGKIRRIEMLIYPTLSPLIPLCWERDFYKALRDIVTKLLEFWQTLNLSLFCSGANLVYSGRPQKSKDKQTGCLAGKLSDLRRVFCYFQITYWLFSEAPLLPGKFFKIFCLFFPCDCTHSWIWALGNLGTHLEARSNLTLDFPL